MKNKYYLSLAIVLGNDSMIVSFGNKETEKIFNRKVSKKLPQEIQRNALKKLNIIHAASILKDLEKPPGNRLEKLKGDLSDFHSIRINDQWRIIFIWKSGTAEEVIICDYH